MSDVGCWPDSELLFAVRIAMGFGFALGVMVASALAIPLWINRPGSRLMAKRDESNDGVVEAMARNNVVRLATKRRA